MATFKELKNCKSVKEILNILDDDNFEKFAVFMLVLWCAAPLVVMCAWIYYTCTTNIPGFCSKDFSRMLINILGIITVVFYIISLALRIKTKRVSFKGRIKKEPWLFLLLLVLVWSIISAAVSPKEKSVTFGILLYSEGVLKYLFYAAVLGFAFSIKSHEKKLFILKIFTFIANVAMIIMVCQVWEVDFVARYFLFNKSAMFFNSNHLGYYINMAVLCTAGLFLYDRNKSKVWSAVYILMFAFQFYALILNDTFGCYLASAVTLIFITIVYFCSGTGKHMSALAPLLIAVILSVLSGTNAFKHTDGRNVWENLKSFAGDLGMVATHSSDIADRIKDDVANSHSGNQSSNSANIISDNESNNVSGNISSNSGTENETEEFDIGTVGTKRMRLWIDAVKDIIKRPVFGFGPECWHGERPHNEVLQYALFIGIPGLGFYLAALIMLLVRQLKNIKKINSVTIIALGVAVGYFVSSLFGLTMFYTAPYYFMVLGFAMSPDTKNQSILNNAAE